MQYNYEVLTPDRFQELCQALITHTYADAIAFPVGKRDGGRDALAESNGSVIVFQVKFHRTQDSTGDAAKIVISAFRSELPKIRRLAERGVNRYVLITNLSATAGLDVGQRDRVDASLNAESPIPVAVWWREEVDARLNDAYDIKWSFSEIITSSDLLRKLLEEGLGESQTRRDLAITNYLTAQYTVDEYVKFKQADLQASDLLTLFIDVPASPQRGHGANRQKETRAVMAAISADAPAHATHDYRSARFGSEPAVGAATLLLSPSGQVGLDSVILEGGPGQGKSTLAQYVCQVHRMKILGKAEKLSALPVEHRLAPVRVPFKIDLRDFANWLRRIDPFNGESPMEAAVTPSLESFLAAQIRYLSGGQSFTVDDVYMFLRRVPALIVLDGLDEVAVMGDRRDVIDAVNAARVRLSASATSTQLVVTTRPAATASTPRFSGAEWHLIELRSITEPLIFDYTIRWATARKLDALDIEELQDTLKARLRSPHIMDLARNAMQLTILLQLVHSRGAALPDQRTLLYDRYIDVLFNREADKNRVVRENRQLLVGLHGFVAWRMHAAAQARRANGRVSEDELRAMISEYLASRGYDSEVLDDLFSGVVQRIVAIVSRVEGTFEFEVQPLREYFAGRHLYDTAPSSPVGNPQSGTKLEIFEALSRQPYWLNVTRFYAGCYSVGELAGLADQVESFLTDPQLGRTSFARVIATLLLADRVFQQSPKVTAGVVSHTVDELTVRYAFGKLLFPNEGPVIGVPNDCGREEVVRFVLKRALAHEVKSVRHEAAFVAQESFALDTIFDAWLELIPPAAACDREFERWLDAGNMLGAATHLGADYATPIADRSPTLRKMLAEAGCPSVLADPEAQRILIADALDGRSNGFRGDGKLGWILTMLDARRAGWPAEYYMFGDGPFPSGDPETVDVGVGDLADGLAELLRLQRGEVRGQREAARLVESTVGRCWLAWALAIRGMDGAVGAQDLEPGANPALDPTDVVAAVAAARRRQASGEWWRETLLSTSDALTSRAVISMCLLWATPSVLTFVQQDLEALLEAMSCAEYEAVLTLLVGSRQAESMRRLSSRNVYDFAGKSHSRRTVVALSQRGAEAAKRDVIREASMSELLRDRRLTEMGLGERVERLLAGESAPGLLEEIAELFAGTDGMAIFGYSPGKAQLDDGIAEAVLGEPDRYPIGLLQAADAHVSAKLMGRQTVAAIGRRQRWAAG